LADLFSMLQMVTKEERNSEPVKKMISKISKEVSPTVNEYNSKVKNYKGIIKAQRACLESLKQTHSSRDKINKYEEMVSFDDVASKNLVAFYHDYKEAPGRIQSLSEDIKREQLYLTALEAEIERRLSEADAERRRLAEVAERKRLQEEAERRRAQEEEEKRRAQDDAERRRGHYLNAVQNKITTALGSLQSRINEIEHPLAEALTVATTLFTKLKEVQDTYLRDLRQTLNQLDVTVTDFNNVPRINQLNIAYVQACEGLINNVDTRAVLERDLHWGPFLHNLLKIFVNAIIFGVTFGRAEGFFPLVKAETISLIDASMYELTPP
jgi:DNA repair exonuclease SbcCD ATPase subunit